MNDYLARRDTQWMGSIYRFLGLTVDTIVHGLDDDERRRAYAADITYGTNNEFGFDYLRDNMKFSLEEYVQRDFHYAIVDEVDSILVDEARTPLIISGPAEESTQLYYTLNQVARQLKNEQDFTVDEKARSVLITEEGVAHAEKLVNLPNLYDPRNIEVLHHLQAALKAHNLFKRDVDYIVKDGQVLIVDEFTGRLMPGRRYSDGLHQALEAKEGGEDRKRKPDPGHHHLPELLPHVRQTGGHDRHRRHRSRGVQEDLQPGSHGHPHRQKDDPGGPPRLHLSDRGGKVYTRWWRISGIATSGGSRCWWAPPPSKNRNT